MSKWYTKSERIVDIANDLRLLQLCELTSEPLRDVHFELVKKGKELYKLIRQLELDIEKLVKEDENK